MSFTSEIRWTGKKPADLVDTVDKYNEDLNAGVLALLQGYAEKIQAEMKAYAPWHDVTGEARARLAAFVEETAGQFTLVAMQGVSYGIYLELKNAGRYAIVGPTMERYQGLIMQDLRRLMGKP